jgi:hypothetical protein
MWGNGYLFLTVTVLSGLESLHKCCVLSFFDTKIGGQPHGEQLGRMHPLSSNSCSWIFNSVISFHGIRFGRL